MVNPMLFCPICGGPIRPPTQRTGEAWSDDIEWQTKAILLSDPEEEFVQLESHYKAGKRKGILPITTRFDPDAAIRQEHASITWSRSCILEDGREVRPNWIAGFGDTGAPFNTLYGITVHESCLDIAQRVMRRSQNGIHVRSLRVLWKVLRTRHDARDNEYMGTVEGTGPQYIVMDHGYYMPLGFTDDFSVWGGDDKHWVVADPINLPDLTSQIVSNVAVLERKSADASATAFHRLFLSLPQELQDRVVSFMGSFEGLSTQCTRLLPQETWLQILLGGRYLSFLWDLDAAAILAFRERKAKEGVELDWELVVRQLTKGVRSTWKHHGTLEAHFGLYCYNNMSVPNGLRNRRRIWQLVEEMYVGDVLPIRRSWVNSKQLPTMPRYWDEYGDPVYPVIRVTGVLEEA